MELINNSFVEPDLGTEDWEAVNAFRFPSPGLLETDFFFFLCVTQSLGRAQ